MAMACFGLLVRCNTVLGDFKGGMQAMASQGRERDGARQGRTRTRVGAGIWTFWACRLWRPLSDVTCSLSSDPGSRSGQTLERKGA